VTDGCVKQDIDRSSVLLLFGRTEGPPADQTAASVTAAVCGAGRERLSLVPGHGEDSREVR
jgi:hypothetical protein